MQKVVAYREPRISHNDAGNIAGNCTIQALERTNDPRWPNHDAWEALNRRVGGRLARAHAAAIREAMNELRQVVPEFTSYVAESNYFEQDWQRAFWGGHYAKLLQIKAKYDAEGLFLVHHGMGSEAWSADGFIPLA